MKNKKELIAESIKIGARKARERIDKDGNNIGLSSSDQTYVWSELQPIPSKLKGECIRVYGDQQKAQSYWNWVMWVVFKLQNSS